MRKNYDFSSAKRSFEIPALLKLLAITHFNFPVTIEPQPEGGYFVSFPDVPEAITQGESIGDALKHGADALVGGLSFYIDDGKQLPLPSRPKGTQRTICPSPDDCARLSIYRAMIERGIEKAELATQLKWELDRVNRLFDLCLPIRIDELKAAAQILRGMHR